MYSGNASPSTINPIAANIHGDFTNIRMGSHSTMDIDSWTCEMRPQSDLAKSYSIGGQPTSIGNVRQIVVSEHSGGNQIYSDGQPPSINDIRRREASQSEASCNRYEGIDEHEVQQIVYKRGTFGRSNEILPPTTFNFNSTDLAIKENGFLNGGVLAPPPQPFQRIGTCIKVYKRGTVERPIDIVAHDLLLMPQMFFVFN